MICVSCRFCADHGIPAHLCITAGDTADQQLGAIAAAFKENAQPLLDDLARHPARPLLWTGEELNVPVLRAVGATWCTCGA